MKILLVLIMLVLAFPTKAQSNTTLSLPNFSPLNVGNKYQYYVYRINVPGMYGTKQFSIDRDTIIGGNKYYFKEFVWLRIDSTGKLFSYNLSANEEKLIIDFNWETDQTIVSGVSEIFGEIIPWKGLSSNTYIKKWAYGIGEFYSFNISDPPGSPEIITRATLIQMVKNENDSLVIYSHNYYPEIIYKPLDRLLNFQLEITLKVNHYFTFFHPPYNPFQFIDLINIESFYKLDDSIINPDTIVILSEWDSPNFSTTINLDSSLLSKGFEFYYRIQAKDKGIIPHYSFNPDSGYYKIALPNITGINESLTSLDFYLSQNYPNPFNPSTRISWQSPVSSWQTLKVYDVLGNEIVTLVNEEKPAGEYEIELDAGKYNLSSGIYFYQLKAGSYIQTNKMILMK